MKTDVKVIEFLEHSNWIENVHDEDSLRQAMKAWIYLASKKKLTHYIVKKVHSMLMVNQDLEEADKGRYRLYQVGINTPTGFIEKMRWEKIPTEMDRWLEMVNGTKHVANSPSTVEDFIKSCHIIYENIHPFADGNGRTGRMFLNWQRIQIGLPILTIRLEERWEYYKWFEEER